MTQNTLAQDYELPTPKPRQLQAIILKNFTLLWQSVWGVLVSFVVAIILVGVVGGLHTFYVTHYNSINDKNTSMTPIPMPMETQPANINHNIHFTHTGCYNSTGQRWNLCDSFGTLPEDSSGTGQFLGRADKRWLDETGLQLRVRWSIPQDANASVNQSSIPFATINSYVPQEEEGKELDNSRDFSSPEELDSYVNKTVYELMKQDIESEHSDAAKPSDNNQFTHARSASRPGVVLDTLTQDDYNKTATFLFDKHEKLFTAAVNYSYLSYPIDRFGAPKVGDIGWDYTISSYTSHQTKMSYGLSNFFHLGGTQYMLYNLFIRSTFEPREGKDQPMIQGYYKQFWESYVDQGADPFTPIFSCIAIPFAFYILVPLFTYQLSQEKGDGLLSLQQMMGLKYSPRYFGDMIYQLIISIVLYVIVMGGCAISDLDIMKMYWPVWLFSTLLFAFNVPVLSQLLASIYDSGRITALLAVVVVIVEVVVSFMWGNNFYNADFSDRTVSIWWSLLPGIAPISCLTMISGLLITQDSSKYITVDNKKYFSIIKYMDGTMMASSGYAIACSLLIGYTTLVLYALISVYIDRITPRKNGIPEHPLFFLQSLYERCCVRFQRQINEITWKNGCWALGQMFAHPSILLIPQQEIDHYTVQCRGQHDVNEEDSDEEQTTSQQTSSSHFDYIRGKIDSTQRSTTTGVVEKSQSQASQTQKIRQVQKNYKNQNKLTQKDEDLIRERELTVNGTVAFNGHKPLIRLLGLCKTYMPARHKAVRNVTYTVGENECLCLLGANGCGKTTQINMLCMLFKPTRGTAYICGKSITDRRARQYIQSNLGVCPQFDILYPTMTIKQHLRFYARIKGISKKLQEQHINDLLAAVELTPHANNASKKLSGGMKRRLSISIALCCKPKVLIFDEPSSGLDVATRRQLWNVIINARQGRAVLLTTHAMEEAECLATRIAIMATGKIRCIGTTDHLQSKFGSGYQLAVCVDREKHLEQNPVYVGSVYLSSREEQAAHESIKQIDPSLTLASCYQGRLVYIVPESAVISDLFGKMEQLVQEPSSGICDWGLNQTSLESVFIKVVSQSY